MRFSRHLYACIAALMLSASMPLSSAAPSSAMPKKAWITTSDAGFRQLRQRLPGIAPVASGQLAGSGQTIYVLSVSETDLDIVADAIHQRLRQCGGFVFHKTEADARAALRMTTAASPSPSYAIAHRDLVEPVLVQMSDKNIEELIVKLSAFPNRFYKSQAGVDAFQWLFAKWTEMAAGRPDITVKQFTHADYPQKSVILSIAGSGKADENIVLGAHLD